MEGEAEGKSSNYFRKSFVNMLKPIMYYLVYFTDKYSQYLETNSKNHNIAELEKKKKTDYCQIQLPHSANEGRPGELYDVSMSHLHQCFLDRTPTS